MNMLNTRSTSQRRRVTATVAALCAVLVWGALSFANAAGAFEVTDFDVSIVNADGTPVTQAGSHPYAMTTYFRTGVKLNDIGKKVPDGSMKTVRVALPPGLIGNPQAVPQCTHREFNDTNSCPAETQLGYVWITVANAEPGNPQAIYNMTPPPGSPAQFGFSISGTHIYLTADVRTGSDYAVTVGGDNFATVVPIYATQVTFWGVPADPSHDVQRCRDLSAGPPVQCPSVSPEAGGPNKSTAALQPFLTMPTSCGDPLTTTISVAPWQDPNVFQVRTATTPAMTGCDLLEFNPGISVVPDDPTAGAPSGYSVDVSIPQNDAPTTTAVANLKRAVVTLPEGTAVSPSSASGLEACTPAQIGLDTAAAPACPEASKIGSVSIDTPLLGVPLEGGVYLAKQGENPFGSMLAIYLTAEAQGVRIKLPGRVAPDPATGQLVTTFDDTPQLPFSRMHLHFKGGDRAPLVNPSSCGTKTASGDMLSWAGGSRAVTSTFEISGDGRGGPCAGARFQPTLNAGVADATAGRSSTFDFQIARTDADGELRSIRTVLPRGLLARVKDVTLCPAVAAAAGSCGPESLVGRVSVGTGAGAHPFYITNGRAYFTEGYGGAPFGLSMVVPAVAGPLDLGTVVVRAAVRLDPITAQVTVDTDPLPTILQGIPLKLRDIRLSMDRPGFMINPTNCAEQQVAATVTSTTGTTATLANRFQVGDCAALPLKPKLKLALTGETAKRKNPKLTAHLDQAPGQSGLKRVAVALPKTIGIDLRNTGRACSAADAAANRCPGSSIVGHAAVRTVLHQPLEGPVYFVEGTRTDANGKKVATLPDLVIPLRGEGVEIDLRASSSIVRNGIVATFDNIPDAPIESFDLTIDGGPKGILLIGDVSLCKATQKAYMEVDGQNGKTADGRISVATDCRLQKLSHRVTAKDVRLRLGGLRAGKVTVSGAQVRTTRKTVRGATTVATVTVPLTQAARRAVKQHRLRTVAVKVTLRPSGGAATSRTYRLRLPKGR